MTGHLGGPRPAAADPAPPRLPAHRPASASAAPGASYSVLFVCTGNLYRSPLAERLLVARLGPDTPVRVASAGTQAVRTDHMDRETRSVLTELGGDGEDFRPQPLTARLVAEADLVLGMEHRHREAAVRLAPTAMRRCFTLKEFIRLSEGDHVGTEPGRDLAAHAAGRRGSVIAPLPVEDGIADPMGAPHEVLRRCAGDIDALVARLAALLTAALGPAART
ncbi:low molecular weight phosphatase family protein [Streptomyces sp. NPDC048604]|uniref:arsenate reductase/protein-tyrosine-phosphatase family protein n=1 Tax=Streptomyces sp. NPDC048604 TaxID=3365578 RepID=UPI0037140516